MTHQTRLTGYVFDSPRPIIEAMDAVLGTPRQHDHHVKRFRSWQAAYGDWDGFKAAQVRREDAHRFNMATAEGRAFEARVAKSHKVWRDNR